MRKYASVIVGSALVGIVACGDDTGSTSAGSGGGASTGAASSSSDAATVGTTASTGSGTDTTAATSGGGDATGDGGGGTGGDPSGDGGAGSGTGGDASGAGGGSFSTPCGAICAGEGCDTQPPEPSDACMECVQGEAAQGTDSECTVDGATGPCCQENDDCRAFVSCFATGGTQEECAEENPAGYEQITLCVLDSCGECDGIPDPQGTGGGGGGGAGGGEPGPPCAEACADDPGCEEEPAAPSGDCQACLEEETAEQSGCVLQGALSPCCQDDEGCSAFIECVAGGTDTTICALTNLAGAQRAQECVAESCGECGSPSE
jgi:hypothetical protein